MDVGACCGLGLGQYEATFRENRIDADVLAELTEADLAQLGVPLGDRKRLLKAIANLAAPQRPSSRPAAPDAAERRQLTVMFCDLGPVEMMDDGSEALIGFVGAHRDAFELHELAKEVLDQLPPFVDLGVEC